MLWARFVKPKTRAYKEFWILICSSSFFVCNTLFLCHFVFGLSFQLSTSLIIAENLACTYLPFVQSLKWKLKWASPGISFPPGDAKHEKGRWQNKQKTNLQLKTNFPHEANSQNVTPWKKFNKLPHAWNTCMNHLGKGGADKLDEFLEKFQRAGGRAAFSIQKFMLQILGTLNRAFWAWNW